MIKIFKYRLAFKTVQNIQCSWSKVLDIQIQEGWPFIWVVVDSELPEKELSIVMIETGNDALSYFHKSYRYISTTKTDGYVSHWWAKEREV